MNNISSFKIHSNLLDMTITTIDNCIIDFGDGTQRIIEKSITQLPIRHRYNRKKNYVVKITGNHIHFHAPRDIIESFQLSDTIISCKDMFVECINLIKLHETFSIPESVTDCSSMFLGCSNLTIIPSTLTIPNSVTNCSNMFADCKKLRKIPETFILSEKILDCSGMFYRCIRLVKIPKTFKLPNSVTNCSNMFADCQNLEEIPETFILPNSIKDCSWMFSYCKKICKIPETFILPEESDLNCTGIFLCCINLIEIPKTFKIPLSATSCYKLFSGCEKLKKIPDIILYNKNADYRWMFAACNNLNLSNLRIHKNIKLTELTEKMFYEISL